MCSEKTGQTMAEIRKRNAVDALRKAKLQISLVEESVSIATGDHSNLSDAYDHIEAAISRLGYDPTEINSES